MLKVTSCDTMLWEPKYMLKDIDVKAICMNPELCSEPHLSRPDEGNVSIGEVFLKKVSSDEAGMVKTFPAKLDAISKCVAILTFPDAISRCFSPGIISA